MRESTAAVEKTKKKSINVEQKVINRSEEKRTTRRRKRIRKLLKDIQPKNYFLLTHK
jgi:hypothetical protein